MNMDKVKAEEERRAKIIRGQIEGFLKMIDEDKYCPDILDQSLSIQNSLKSLDGLILERHLRMHVAHQFKENKEAAIKELLSILKRKKRNE